MSPTRDTADTLSQGQIRLLKLDGFGGGDKRPCFTVHIIETQEQPSYSALSYVWGVDEPTQKIYLDGKPVLVRCNLYNFCYYLTREFWEYGPPKHWDFIWIDALCIKQSNVWERNAQVAVMDRIYRNAAVVIVWLGELRGHDGKGFRASTQHERDMIGLNGFDDSAYWTRMWTVQEFMSAKRIHFFASNDLDQSMDWIEEEVIAQTYRMVLGFGRGGSHPYRLALWEKQQPGDFTKPQSLLDLLIAHDDSECLDPRDRVFALLAITKPQEREFLSHFFPDYSLDHEIVVTIALSAMQHFKGRALLGEFIHEGPKHFEQAMPMSDSYHGRYDAPWPKTVLSAMGLASPTEDDIVQWQQKINRFDIVKAHLEAREKGQYHVPRFSDLSEVTISAIMIKSGSVQSSKVVTLASVAKILFVLISLLLAYAATQLI